MGPKVVGTEVITAIAEKLRDGLGSKSVTLNFNGGQGASVIFEIPFSNRKSPLKMALVRHIPRQARIWETPRNGLLKRTMSTLSAETLMRTDDAFFITESYPLRGWHLRIPVSALSFHE